MTEKKFYDEMTEISVQISKLDVMIQTLIKDAHRNGKLKERYEDLQELIFEMKLGGDTLLEKLKNPESIQPFECI